MVADGVALAVVEFPVGHQSVAGRVYPVEVVGRVDFIGAQHAVPDAHLREVAGKVALVGVGVADVEAALAGGLQVGRNVGAPVHRTAAALALGLQHAVDVDANLARRLVGHGDVNPLVGGNRLRVILVGELGAAVDHLQLSGVVGSVAEAQQELSLDAHQRRDFAVEVPGVDQRLDGHRREVVHHVGIDPVDVEVVFLHFAHDVDERTLAEEVVERAAALEYGHRGTHDGDGQHVELLAGQQVKPREGELDGHRGDASRADDRLGGRERVVLGGQRNGLGSVGEVVVVDQRRVGRELHLDGLRLGQGHGSHQLHRIGGDILLEQQRGDGRLTVEVEPVVEVVLVEVLVRTSAGQKRSGGEG